MEFLKHKWGYLLLAAAVFLAAAVVWYLLFLNREGDSYAGGMLVNVIRGIKEMAV